MDLDLSHLGAVPGLVARQAELRPQALAVSDGDTVLTYARLVSAARALAAELTAHGVGPGSAVGLLAARSTRLVVAQLAVWWAGGHVVPLDPAHPRPRTAGMLADAGVTLTLGDKALLAEAGIPAGQALTLDLDGLPEAAAGGPDPACEGGRALALVLYTSGSTGRPKGVEVPHRAIAGLVTAPDAVRLGPGDRMLFHSPSTFDASSFEMWAPLAAGAAVMVSPAERPTAEDLARDVERFGVTHTFLTTALFHQLAARRSRVFGLLRTLLVGGEALSPEHAGAVLRAFPWLELVNAYGPTEATTFTTLQPLTEAGCAGPVPIGRPFGGATVLVLDERLEPVPAGGRGELWIGGTRLAFGYLGQPELTAQRFREIPGAGRMYRSGDLVSVRPDGALDFHGRADDQVKVRGFRIEPGEVEHTLRTHPEVSETAVVVHRAGTPDAALTAFVVPADGARPAGDALRGYLAERLPAHLVPTGWAVVAALPLTGTGKVDRRALAETGPDGAAPPAEAPAAALTPLEQEVAEVWARALGHPVERADADFLAEGGHSLMAMWVVDDLREDLGVDLTLAEFFAHPTVAGQAALVERALLDALADPTGADDHRTENR
ncbi:non-ribosomal peptide synthetase [Kitasatospora sp. MBT63]|uniref:non-ribosomal peptide synthetase n=1 Tax=Kitasatospora sp. MBT63 TaxID=1444768 RepID=UPI00068A9D00|nr:non-ribosomal peptide synthetase [Kitasatospora sp. MBT63]